MEHSFQYFVGIDWGTQTRRVVLLDGSGRAVEQYNADHSGEGLVTLVNSSNREPLVSQLWSQSASR